MSTQGPGQFPEIRLRRGRRTDSLRSLIAETGLSSADFIYPVFVLDGEGRSEPVESMPGIHRHSVDRLMDELAQVVDLGIPAIALFPGAAGRDDPQDPTDSSSVLSEPSGRPIPNLRLLQTLRWTLIPRMARMASSMIRAM